MGAMNIRDIRPGMILAADVIGDMGRRLLPRGTTLTAGNLRVLSIWGVTEADIAPPDNAGSAESPTPTADPGPGNPARDHVDRLFRDANLDHPAMAELYRLRLDEPTPEPTKNPGRLQDAPPAAPREAAGPARSGSSRTSAGPAAPGDSPALEPTPATPLDLLRNDPTLPAFPEVYFQLRQALDDPTVSATHLADIVGRDPSLAARLLRLANSPFYGFSKRVDSLSRGVMMIGAGELTQLVLGVTVVGMFNELPKSALTMRQIWEHAVGAGVFARILASRLRGLSQERAFVCGLLHDIGRLIMLRSLPRRMDRAMALAREERRPLHEVETRLFGWSHADMAEALISWWRLPENLGQTIRAHHGPFDGPEAREAAVIHLADIMTIAWERGFNGAPGAPRLDPAAWELLGLPTSVLAVAVSQSRRQIDDILSTLFQ